MQPFHFQIYPYLKNFIMKRPNLFFALVLLFTATFFSNCVDSFADEPHTVKKFDASSISYLDVNTSGGSINTYGSSGSNEIVVEMYVNSWKTKDKEKINKELESFDIKIAKEGDKIVASARNKSTFGNNHISISFKVYTPSAMSADLNTSGGSITMKGLSGNQKLNTSGGSITMEELNGDVHATTSGGSINISNVRGELKGTTSGGSINANNLNGSFNLSTSGGSIKLEDIKGNISAHTSGGGIRANIVELTGDVTLKTSGGSINATLPDNTGMNVYFSGNSVNTTLNNFSGKSEDDKVDGTINGGGSKVTLVTSGGSVNVNYQ